MSHIANMCTYCTCITFACIHLADILIKSPFQCIQDTHVHPRESSPWNRHC